MSLLRGGTTANILRSRSKTSVIDYEMTFNCCHRKVIIASQSVLKKSYREDHDHDSSFEKKS